MKLNKLIVALLYILIFTLPLAIGQKPSYPSDIVVSQDGTGNFTTIQEAVNSVRDLLQQRVTIHIKKGIYHEKLIIPSWKTKISLIGEDKENTIITNSDFSGKLTCSEQ